MDETRDKRLGRARVDALHQFLARVGPGPDEVADEFGAATAEVLAEFDEAGVDALLLKGRGLATVLYGAGAHRSFSDIDLLVAPASFDAAGDALARLRYVDAGADDVIDDIGGVIHALTWIRAGRQSGAHIAIDLHRRLPGANADPVATWEALAGRRTWIEIGGRPAAVLDRVGQAMHLATHAAQHGPASDKHVSELAFALAVWPDEVWNSAARLATAVGATEAFAAGLRLCRPGAAKAARLELPATDRLDWAIRHRDERPRGTFHLEAFAGAGSAWERLDVVRRSLFPRRAWIIQQHPWAEQGGWRLSAAYGVHLARSPGWTARAWRFHRRAARAARSR